MSVELLYTSAPQGLKQGSRGFSTVLCTNGLPINLATRLEGLSGYKHVFPPNHAQASSNPVCYSHLKFIVGGKSISILSRISDYGIDYSQRTNKLAHHIVIDTNEQPAAGPAWLLLQPGFMRTQWDGACKTLPVGPAIPHADQSPSVCRTWQSLMGDAGWGGVVADAFMSNNTKPLWVIYKLEQASMLLKLINEAIALLPAHERWRSTFSTYVTNLPPEADCKVRFVLEGSEEARVAIAKIAVINLSKPTQLPTCSRLVLIARGSQPASSDIEKPGLLWSEDAFQQTGEDTNQLDAVTVKAPPTFTARNAPPSTKGVPPTRPPIVTTDYRGERADSSHRFKHLALLSALSVCLVFSIGVVLFSYLGTPFKDIASSGITNSEASPQEVADGTTLNDTGDASQAEESKSEGKDRKTDNNELSEDSNNNKPKEGAGISSPPASHNDRNEEAVATQDSPQLPPQSNPSNDKVNSPSETADDNSKEVQSKDPTSKVRAKSQAQSATIKIKFEVRDDLLAKGLFIASGTVTLDENIQAISFWDKSDNGEKWSSYMREGASPGRVNKWQITSEGLTLNFKLDLKTCKEPEYVDFISQLRAAHSQWDDACEKLSQALPTLTNSQPFRLFTRNYKQMKPKDLGFDSFADLDTEPSIALFREFISKERSKIPQSPNPQTQIYIETLDRVDKALNEAVRASRHLYDVAIGVDSLPPIEEAFRFRPKSQKKSPGGTSVEEAVQVYTVSFGRSSKS